MATTALMIVTMEMIAIMKRSSLKPKCVNMKDTFVLHHSILVNYVQLKLIGYSRKRIYTYLCTYIYTYTYMYGYIYISIYMDVDIKSLSIT